MAMVSTSSTHIRFDYDILGWEGVPSPWLCLVKFCPYACVLLLVLVRAFANMPDSRMLILDLTS